MVNTGKVLPGAGPGEALYHELVHAMQVAYGKLSRSLVPENTDIRGFSEFCAIVAANMYRSERGFVVMRSNSTGFEGERSESDEYYSFYESQFKKWFALQPDFCTEMAGSPAKFNPLRAAAIDLNIAVPTSMQLPP